MSVSDTIPFGPWSQRALSRRWGTLVGARAPLADVLHAKGVRSVVRESWHRSIRARVSPELTAAPKPSDEQSLIDATGRADWLGAARDVVARDRHDVAGKGHILSLFDDEGRMLHAEGDAAALDGLAEINFCPGGVWSEAAVGTNGPGTALANGIPTHIVGAEHYCQRWHRWHCAAVPIHDAATARTIGVIDISGFREQAHPHTLALAIALGLAVEQALIAKEAHRRYLVLQRHAVLAARYPGDPIMAIDRAGTVLTESSGIAADLSARLAALVGKSPRHLGTTDGAVVHTGSREIARWFPVFQERTLIGGCVVLERRAAMAGDPEMSLTRSDVRAVATRLFQAAARDLGRLGVTIDPQALDAFEAYHWPGNTRELKHVVRRVLASTMGTITLRDLPHVIREAYAGAGDSLNSAIDSEDARLIDVVRDSSTMAEAAARLGVTRSTLYRRMERFGLRPRRVVGHG